MVNLVTWRWCSSSCPPSQGHASRARDVVCLGVHGSQWQCSSPPHWRRGHGAPPLATHTTMYTSMHTGLHTTINTAMYTVMRTPTHTAMHTSMQTGLHTTIITMQGVLQCIL